MSGESDENFDGVTKIFPDKKFPRHFITRPKLLPDFFYPRPKLLPKILYSNQMLNPNFYTLKISVELKDIFSN